MPNPVDDLKSVVDSIKNPGYEPKPEDVRYVLVPRNDKFAIEKIVVTSYEGKKGERVEAVIGYVYGKPNTAVRIKMPYPIFKTLDDLLSNIRSLIDAI